jgi:ATP-dependent Clp protease, protease subunit
MPEVTLNILQTIGREPGELSSKEFIERLQQIPETVDRIYVDINSEGGSVFEGNAIAEALKQHPASVTTRCIGSALSIASVIFLAGDERLIAENGWIMIHEPMSEGWGTAKEIRQQADLIDGIREKMVQDYNESTDISASQAERMMRDETWFDSNDAISYGFATGITGKAMAVALRKNKFKNMPQRFLAFNVNAPNGNESSITEDLKMSNNSTVGQTIAAIRARCRGADSEFILSQLEAGTSLDDITAVHNEEQRKEIDDLKQALAIAEATISQYEEQMAQEEEEEVKEETTEETVEEEEEAAEENVEAMDEEDHEAMDEEKKAMDEDEKKTAKASSSIRPVATKIRNGSRPASFRAKWEEAITDYISKTGSTRDRAIKMVNRNHPGLREQVINESKINQTRNVAV